MFGKKGKAQSEGGQASWGSAQPSQGGDGFWGDPGAASSAGPPPSSSPSQASSSAESVHPGGSARDLLELVDPLFQFICRIHRVDKEGGDLNFSKVRVRAEELIDAMEKSARKNPALQAQYLKIKDAVLWYIDYWIGSSGAFSSIRSEWNRNRMGKLPEDGEMVLTGDEAFFDELEKTLKIDSGDRDANERLAFYYTAVGLGFTGPYFKSIPEHQEALRAFMDKMYPRVKIYVESSKDRRITPESYNYTDRRDFIAPTRDRPMILWLAGLFLTASMIFGYLWFYGHHKKDLERQVKSVLETKIIKEEK